MAFKLGKRSRENLVGVRQELIAVVERAIELTDIDFGVTEGIRSIGEQRDMFARGLSQTMNSKHLDGSAVDLVAYIGNRVTWELQVYPNVADAMKKAASELGVAVRWGGAWNIPDICRWIGP